jgi:hypothetical protein
LGNSRVRVVARICAALLALFFVVAIGLFVVLPRFCGEGVARVHLSEAAISAIGCEIEITTLVWRKGGPNRAVASEEARWIFTKVQLSGIPLKDSALEDDISACEGSFRLHSMCG